MFLGTSKNGKAINYGIFNANGYMLHYEYDVNYIFKAWIHLLITYNNESKKYGWFHYFILQRPSDHKTVLSMLSC